MIRLPKRCQYAIAAVTFMAKHATGVPLMVGTLAEACDLPETYLSKILQQLAQAGVVASRRGRRGGYMLRKSPAKTTLLEIIEAMEGPVRQWQQVGSAAVPASRIERQLVMPLRDVAKYMEAVFGRVSVRQLIADKSTRRRCSVR